MYKKRISESEIIKDFYRINTESENRKQELILIDLAWKNKKANMTNVWNRMINDSMSKSVLTIVIGTKQETKVT